MSTTRASRLPHRVVQARHAPWHVLVLLVLLEGLTYGSYFLGLTVVNGDTNAHYLSDSYYWWNHGGILSPPDWVPYTWMGRPAGSNLQDGSYVLAQGLANLVSPWSPTVSAITSALLTAFGAVGMYLLVRRMWGNHYVALLALVAQFYAPNILSNAQFLDFHRATVYLPWFLLILSPLWFWERRWGLPLAALLLWQIFVGSYPGWLIGAAVCVLAWAVAWLFDRSRGNGWIWRVAVAGVVSVALSAVKLVPALLVGTGERNDEGQRVLLSVPNLASIFFPYDNPSMTWDIALRPFFVVVPVLVLMVLARWRSAPMRPVVALGASPLILILLAQYARGFLESLPGMDLSRFQVNEFKTFLVAAVILAGASGAERVWQREVSTSALWIAGGGVFVVAVGLALSLDHGGGAKRLLGLALPFVLIAVATVLLVGLVRSSPGTPRAAVAAFGVLLTAVVSGLGFAYLVTSTWASSRVNVEVGHYGVEVSELVSAQPCDAVTERRPARREPDTEPEDYWHDVSGLAGAFDCSLAVSGYANVPGNPTLRDQAQALIDDSTGELLTFFMAPGAVAPATSDGRAADVTRECLDGGQCDGLRFTPVAYDPDGRFEYEVVAEQAMTAVLNESYYRGWSGQACTDAGPCQDVRPRAGDASALLVDLPKGTSRCLSSSACPTGRSCVSCSGALWRPWSPCSPCRCGGHEGSDVGLTRNRCRLSGQGLVGAGAVSHRPIRLPSVSVK